MFAGYVYSFDVLTVLACTAASLILFSVCLIYARKTGNILKAKRAMCYSFGLLSGLVFLADREVRRNAVKSLVLFSLLALVMAVYPAFVIDFAHSISLLTIVPHFPHIYVSFQAILTLLALAR